MRKTIARLLKEYKGYEFILGYLNATQEIKIPKEIVRESAGFKLGYLYSKER